jgi:hypothetical protein
LTTLCNSGCVVLHKWTHQTGFSLLADNGEYEFDFSTEVWRTPPIPLFSVELEILLSPGSQSNLNSCILCSILSWLDHVANESEAFRTEQLHALSSSCCCSSRVKSRTSGIMFRQAVYSSSYISYTGVSLNTLGASCTFFGSCRLGTSSDSESAVMSTIEERTGARPATCAARDGWGLTPTCSAADYDIGEVACSKG